MSNYLKIATPISHQFENELFAQEIIKVSDCLEVRERSMDSNWPNQILTHIDFDLTHEWDSQIKDYLRMVIKTKPQLKLITLQATRCCHDEELIDGIFQLKGKVYTREELVMYAKVNVDWLRSMMPSCIDIGLENNNYYPTQAYDIITDGDFITEVVEKNELMFLFDIAHGMVTAHNKDISYNEYLDTLPMHKAIQLHICQPELVTGEIGRDAHDEPSEEMFLEVKKLIDEFPTINYLTIEYYKDKNILVDSINRLRRIIA